MSQDTLCYSAAWIPGRRNWTWDSSQALCPLVIHRAFPPLDSEGLSSLISFFLPPLSVVSCDWLALPSSGRKNSTNYLAGSVVGFQCSPGYTLSGSAERTCQSNGEWSGDSTMCLPSTGRPPLQVLSAKGAATASAEAPRSTKEVDVLFQFQVRGGGNGRLVNIKCCRAGLTGQVL